MLLTYSSVGESSEIHKHPVENIQSSEKIMVTFAALLLVVLIYTTGPMCLL